MYHKKLYRKPKHILCSITLFRKLNGVEKYYIAGQATDKNVTVRMRIAYRIYDGVLFKL
jgi:hypothetical protein